MEEKEKKPKRTGLWPRKLVWLLVFFAILGAIIMVMVWVLGHKQE